jgi:hypothetical protein
LSTTVNPPVLSYASFSKRKGSPGEERANLTSDQTICKESQEPSVVGVWLLARRKEEKVEERNVALIEHCAL